MNILLFALMAVSIYLAGRLAEHRGRSFKKWAWVAAFIGPLALPLLLLLPSYRSKNGGASNATG